MHSLSSSLPPALPGSHLFIHLCIHALIQHTFFLCLTPVQARRLTSLPGQDLSPILRDGQAVCSDSHGRGSDERPQRTGPILGAPEGGLLWTGSGSKALVDKVLALEEKEN